MGISTSLDANGYGGCMELTPDHAARFAAATLAHLGREYPYKMDLVLTGPEDAKPPRQHHPIFHGSFDWHSCVHGWWQILRLARRFPDLPVAAEIRARADEMLVPDKVAGELEIGRAHVCTPVTNAPLVC